MDDEWKTNLFSAYDRHLTRTGGGHSALQGEAGDEREGDPAAEAERLSIARHLGMDQAEDKHLMWIAELVRDAISIIPPRAASQAEDTAC